MISGTRRIVKFCVLMVWIAVAIMANVDAQEVMTQLPQLEKMIGSWDVVSERRLSANGPWETTRGKSTITKTVHSTLIEEDYSGTLDNKPLSIKTIIAFNRFVNKFQKIFIDSEHGMLVDYEGVKQGDSLLFDKLWTYPSKSTVKLRVVYTFISSDEFTVENMRMPENTIAWDVTGRMRYKRKK